MRRFLVLLPLLAPAVQVSAQSDPTLMTRGGYWKPANRNLSSEDAADGPDLEPFAANLDAVLAILRRAPALTQPRGFVADPVIERSSGAPRRPLTGSVRVRILFFRHDDAGAVTPQDAGPDVAVAVNDASCIWSSHEAAFVDSTGPIYYEAPRDSSSVRGIPGYSSDSSCLVIARRGVPVFAAVPKERFLRDARDTLLARLRGESMAALDSADPRVLYRQWLGDAAARRRQRDSLAAGLEGLSAELRKQALASYDTGQATMGAMLKEQARTADAGGGFSEMRRTQQAALDTVRALAMHYDAELKGMPAAERRAAAWVKTSDAGVQDLAPAGAPDARQLVAPNPALFNSALPRSAIQVLTIQAVVASGDDGATGLLARIREGIDYGALAALLR